MPGYEPDTRIENLPRAKLVNVSLTVACAKCGAVYAGMARHILVVRCTSCGTDNLIPAVGTSDELEATRP